MHAVVTGVAGFIGSHLAEHLLDHGDTVQGVDAFTDYYARDRKEGNVAELSGRAGFHLVEGDLLDLPLPSLVRGADVVFHLAGQPGVRPSWGPEFETYTRQNVLGTQRVLEACRTASLWKLVYASSSSIYGDAECLPTRESTTPHPVSPYGVTKLAAEHLCELYRGNFDVPTASLRLFTVYGPRQRPDMAFAQLVDAALSHEEFTLYGDGRQSRDFTFVGDVVTAMRQAAVSDWTGVANIGGGSRTTMTEVLDTVQRLCGPVHVHALPRQDGDARHTSADTTVARDGFGYRPRTSLHSGLEEMIAARLRQRVLVP